MLGAVGDAFGEIIYGYWLATGFAALLFAGALLNWALNPTEPCWSSSISPSIANGWRSRSDSIANLYYQAVATKGELSKHALIQRTLTDAIASGEYEPGQRLPSESQLVKTFGASRPTVNRALRELQLSGVIDRRVGSAATFARMPPPAGTSSAC